MLSISDVLLAGRGVITGPGVISAAVLVCQDGDKLQAHLQPLRWCAVRWIPRPYHVLRFRRGGEAVQICAVLPAPLLRLRCKVLRGLLQEHPLLNWGKDACRVI